MCGARFDHLQCNLIFDKLQAWYQVQFVKDNIVFMRLQISRDLMQKCPFDYIMQVIDDNFKNDVKSMLGVNIIPQARAKQIIDNFACGNTLDLSLEQAIGVCLIHIDLLPISDFHKDGIIKSVLMIKDEHL